MEFGKAVLLQVLVSQDYTHTKGDNWFPKIILKMTSSSTSLPSLLKEMLVWNPGRKPSFWWNCALSVTQTNNNHLDDDCEWCHQFLSHENSLVKLYWRLLKTGYCSTPSSSNWTGYGSTLSSSNSGFFLVLAYRERGNVLLFFLLLRELAMYLCGSNCGLKNAKKSIFLNYSLVAKIPRHVWCCLF